MRKLLLLAMFATLATLSTAQLPKNFKVFTVEEIKSLGIFWPSTNVYQGSTSKPNGILSIDSVMKAVSSLTIINVNDTSIVNTPCNTVTFARSNLDTCNTSILYRNCTTLRWELLGSFNKCAPTGWNIINNFGDTTLLVNAPCNSLVFASDQVDSCYTKLLKKDCSVGHWVVVNEFLTGRNCWNTCGQCPVVAIFDSIPNLTSELHIPTSLYQFTTSCSREFIEVYRNHEYLLEDAGDFTVNRTTGIITLADPAHNSFGGANPEKFVVKIQRCRDCRTAADTIVTPPILGCAPGTVPIPCGGGAYGISGPGEYCHQVLGYLANNANFTKYYWYLDDILVDSSAVPHYCFQGITSANGHKISVSGVCLNGAVTDKCNQSYCSGQYQSTLAQTDATCTGAISNNNGIITLTSTGGPGSAPNFVRYGVSSLNAISYDGPSWSGATPIGALPFNLVTNAPNTGGQYIIRYFSSPYCNSSLAAPPQDDTVMVTNVVCITGGPTCTAPTGVTASSIAQTSCTVSWTAASPTPIDYRIRVYNSSGATLLQTLTTASTSISITGLSAETTYKIRVQSRCAAGNTDNSPDVEITVFTLPVGCAYPVPMAFLNSTTVTYNSGTDQLQVNKAATPTGGSWIYVYFVECASATPGCTINNNCDPNTNWTALPTAAGTFNIPLNITNPSCTNPSQLYLYVVGFPDVTAFNQWRASNQVVYCAWVSPLVSGVPAP